jgi:phytoene dehydrogenase-like protein
MPYDAIIIGAGHNGLVTAAYLAKAGRRVLVLEKREVLGGAAATEEIFSGFKFNTGAHDAGLFRQEIIADLDLKNHGLAFIESPVTVFAPQPDGSAITLWRDHEKNIAEIAKFSKADAEKFPAFIHFVNKLTEILNSIILLTPPSVTQNSFAELLAWAGAGLKLKRSGKRDMMEFLRILPMTITEFLNEWFENEALKAVLGSAGVTGNMQGPQASGTAFMMLYHHLGAANGGFKSSRFVKGGISQLSMVLANVAQKYGAEIRAGVEVAQIKLDNDKATGVILKNGEEISSRVVISNADPRRTFFELIGAPNLGPTFVRRVRNIRYRGTTAKVNLALSDLPRFKTTEAHLSGHILICPNLEYLERAYDDAKYGHYSQKPYLDIVIPTVLDSSLVPAGKHIMSINMQYAPYKLREGNWDENREKLGDHIINTLAEYAPNIKEIVLHRQVLTPLDWERDYSLTEGGEFHGQMGLDQMLFMRPVAGFGQYRTPIENLYLCGAGTHPGGGVTGAPGHNAAREVLKDWKRGSIDDRK